MQRTRFLCAIIIGWAMSAGIEGAAAQSRIPEYVPPPRAPSRITVTPNRRLVRECVDWYAVENRLSGTVVTPQMRCRWSYR